MKNFTNGCATLKSNVNSYSKLFIVLFFSFFSLIFNAKATIGDSCNNPIVVTATATYAPVDVAIGDSVSWISFVADSTSELIYLNLPINSTDGPVANLKSFYIYRGTCSSLTLIAKDTTINLGVSKDSLLVSGLTVSTTYYVKVVKTTPSAPLTYFSISINRISPDSQHHLLYRTTLSECGLQYVHSEVLITRRMFGIDQVIPDDCIDTSYTYEGDSLPASIVISGMPLCPTNYRNAFIWFTASLFNSADSIATVTITIQPPSGGPATFNLIQVATDIPKCWNTAWGEVGTATYFRDVSSMIIPLANANGTYTITSVTGISNPSEELDGATLLMTWVNPDATYIGNLVLWDGDVTEEGGDTSAVSYNFNSTNSSGFPLSPSCIPDSARAFIIASDLEPTCNFQLHESYLNNCHTFMTMGTYFPNLFWNFDEDTTTISQNQTSLCMGVHHPDGNRFDCFEWAVAGLYYQSPCGSCTPSFTYSTDSTRVICNGDSNGTARITVTSGGPYTYLWTPYGGTDSIAIGLAAGIYTVTVNDPTNCGQAIINVTVTEPDVLEIYWGSSPVSCFGYSDGTANVDVTGGTGTYSYLWTPIGATTSSVSGLLAGDYTVTVTDSNGCTTSTTVTVYSPDPLIGIPVITEACAPGTGKIIINTTGGTPYYSYTWSPNVSSTDSATSLSLGYYSITITDNFGCTDTLHSVYVPGPPALAIFTLHDSCNAVGDHTGEAWVKIITGSGTGPFTYHWNTIPVQTTDTASSLASGTYTVTVTDSTGCSKTATATISISTPSCYYSGSYTFPSGHTIASGDTIWNLTHYPSGIITVDTNLIIQPGATLTIQPGMTVKFNNNSRLIVQRGTSILNGGKLTLNSCTLTSVGDCEWLGVDVYGNDSFSEASGRQAQIIMSWATIENAQSAVYLGDRTQSAVNEHYWTGGIITHIPSSRNYFINNTRSITFPAYYPAIGLTFTSTSAVSNFNFISDRDLYDNCYSRPLWFINISSTNGVTMNQDTFSIYKNTLNYNVPDSAFGIKTADSYFPQLFGCDFMNVNKAIDISYSIPPVKGVYIHNNTIEYSQTGIRFTTGFADTIRYDTIKYAPLYTVTGPVNGIISNNSTKIDVRDDTISNLQYGVTVNNCGATLNSRIWNNTISYCSGYGIGTGGNDGDTILHGITVYCNTLRNDSVGWSAYNYTVNLKTPEQGLCTGDTTVDFPPGNYFSNITFADIYNKFSVTSHKIKYDVETGANANYYPDFNSILTNGLTVSCGSIPTARKQNGYCGHQNSARMEEGYTILSDSSINPALFDSVAYYLEIGMVSNAIVFLDSINTLEANQMLVDIYIGIQDFNDAESLMSNIYSENQDVMDFLFVRGLVCRFGSSGNDSVSDYELSELHDMAVIGSSSICQSEARGILALLYGTYYPIDCYMVGQCQDGENERRFPPHLGKDGKDIPWLGNNHPNPFSNWTDIPYYLPPNTNSAYIEIFDIMGNKMDVYPLTVKEIQATLTISSKNYASGVYFCTMIVDGNKAGWKKLLIIK
jgi:hypothetical protein